MGVAKVPPPRPSTPEPDHAPQPISEDASLTPPPRQASVTLMSACSHVLIDSASIPCSSASSPPTSRRLVGRQPAPPVTSSSDGPRQRGRRLQTQSVHVDHRIDEVEPRTARDVQLHRIDPSSAAIVNGPANFGKNLGCSQHSDKCSVDNSTSSPSR